MRGLCVIFVLIINSVLSYYFYNPNTNHLLARTSLENVPPGYRILQPPKFYRGRQRKGRLRGFCTDGGFVCDQPYHKSQTFQFECTSDDHCPSQYKCCSQKCFVHKICVKATQGPVTDVGKRKFHQDRPGQCERWPYNCRLPYDYSQTYMYKCDYDRQCPPNFKCCSQNCFAHKICSRVTKPSVHEEVTSKVEPAVEEEVTVTVTVTSTESTSTSPTTESTSTVTSTTESTTFSSTESTTEEEITTTEEVTTVEEEEETEGQEEEESTTVEGESETTTFAELPIEVDFAETTTLDSNAIDPVPKDYNYEEYEENEDSTVAYDDYGDEDDYVDDST